MVIAYKDWIDVTYARRQYQINSLSKGKGQIKHLPVPKYMKAYVLDVHESTIQIQHSEVIIYEANILGFLKIQWRTQLVN